MALDAARSRLYDSYSHDRFETPCHQTEVGLTQAALAEAVGVRSNTVARWERGEMASRSRPPGWLEKLAEERKIAKREN